ncbi:MAG: 50S ribosomal protein L25 [Spirochaetaceae bacterium]|jgi:large subunit ribosomal protein L25|nr:50S ribosomal protein L25 [Spirochaetaceae bacterium]
MSQVVFNARKRAGAGSADARRTRRAGRIPAVVYGRSGSAVAIDLNAVEFAAGVKGISGSTIVKVNIDDKAVDAFVKDTQRNILDGNILHVDFYEVESDRLLRARVPLHIAGNPVGVRNGGIFESSLHEIEVECLPGNLPERINVDVSALDENQSIPVRDLELGGGVKLISGGDQVVALVKFAKAEDADSSAEEESAAEPAAKEPAKS